MDFSFSDQQTMVRDLARGILDKEIDEARVKEISASPEWFDRALWSTLAQAGLLGLAVDEDLGGMGFGLEEVCVLLAEIGRVVAPVPVLPTAVAALAVAELGTDAQKRELLAPMAAGDVVLTAALGAIDAPLVSARRDGSGWRLEGRAMLVPAAHLARRMLLPAATGDGTALLLVDPNAEGVGLERSVLSSGEPLFRVELRDVRIEDEDALCDGAKGDDASHESLAWLRDVALVATCAVQVGVSERTLEMTAEYVSGREQFGVPIGTFQAVQHRAADAYIDLQAMRWTTWRAAWTIAQGLAAEREAAVAKFWASEGGARIAASAQHLHGGMGVDIDYPIHRYFLWSKGLELSLGSASAHLARLGRSIAGERPTEVRTA